MVLKLVPTLLGLWAYVWLVRSVHRAYDRRWKTKQRRNVMETTQPAWIEMWFPGLSYLVAGPRILLDNYRRGLPISIHTPETTYVHLSSPDHIRELLDAPEERLSLHALSKDMFMPEYTMNGLVVRDNMQENGSLHTRVLRVLLRSQLPALSEPLYRILSAALDESFDKAAGLAEKNKTAHQDGWSALSTFDVTKSVVVAANALTFFGPRLSASAPFLEAALAYPENLVLVVEMLRLIPSCLRSLVAPMLMRHQRASQTMVDHITSEIERRRHHHLEQETSGDESDGQQQEKLKPQVPDCIQFILDSSGKSNNSRNRSSNEWSSEKMVQVLLGMWFAAVHQPAMALVYALEDLCSHPEYADALREEIASASVCASHLAVPTNETAPATATTTRYETIDSLPLLDAFVRESCRLHPSDSISVRRKVVSSLGGSDGTGADVGGGYVFEDGTRLLQGDVACVPSQAIMLDPSTYGDDSTQFNPSRFLTAGNTPISDKTFTSLDPSYPIWGLGRHACPGRQYASLIMKLTLLHVLDKYDLKLGPPPSGKSRHFHFRSSIIPRASAQIMFRKRRQEQG